MGALPVLYGLERSVYTRIARMALHEKGVACRLTEVEIFGPDGVPESHRLRRPFGRIRCLNTTGSSSASWQASTNGVRIQPG